HKRLFRHPTEDIPGSTLRRDKTPSLTSPLAWGIQPLDGSPYGATPTAALTRVSVRGRSFSTSEIKLLAKELKIRPLAPRRFYLTPPAPKTRPLEWPRF